MSSVEGRLAALETGLADVRADIDALGRQLGHAGMEGTIRGRLHTLENFNAAAKAAEAARRAAETAQAALASAHERRFTVVIAAINVIVVAAGITLSALLR